MAHARTLPEGFPVTAKGLLHLGSRAAVDQALARLAKRNALFRVGRGAYVLPVESRYGQILPLIEQAVVALAEQRGERVAATWDMAANFLGLTTQVPVRQILLTSGRSRRINLGNQEIELRHAPDWQLVLNKTKPGDVVRALAWCGPENAEAAIDKLRPLLSKEECAELASIAGQLPDWLADNVCQIAYG